MIELTERSALLLAVIGSVPRVKGATRLQKSMLLITKLITKNEPYDWKPNHLGAHSQTIKTDTDHLEESNLITATKKNTNKHQVIFESTNMAKKHIDYFKGKNPEKFEKIKTLMDFYQERDEDDLIADTYALYPEYTTKSTIKHKILHALMLRSYNPYKVPFTNIIPNLLSIKDLDITKLDEEFSKISKDSSKIDPNAINDLAGMFSDMFDDYDDANELVKEIR